MQRLKRSSEAKRFYDFGSRSIGDQNFMNEGESPDQEDRVRRFYDFGSRKRFYDFGSKKKRNDQ